MPGKRAKRSHYVHEPIVDGSPYLRQLGRIPHATGRFVPAPRLPGQTDIKHVDFIEGVTLRRYTAVVPTDVLDPQFLALTTLGTKSLCDRCERAHSTQNQLCSANFLTTSPLDKRNILYNIKTGIPARVLLNRHVVESARTVELCWTTTKPVP